MFCVHSWSSGKFGKWFLKMDYFRSEKMWEQVLHEAKNVWPEDQWFLRFEMFSRTNLDLALFLNHDINRALYHKGYLLDNMFQYPQKPQALFLHKLKNINKRSAHDWHQETRRFMDLVFEMGRVNAAERMAHEILQETGDHPSTLRMFAEINIVKNQNNAARVFLGYLSRLRNNPPGQKWAEYMLGYLEDKGEFPPNERLDRIRSLNVRRDSIIIWPSVPYVMEELLASNPNNRMAFEYLMAHYLVSSNVWEIASSIGRFRALGYERLPVHIQEAVLLFTVKYGMQVDLYDYKIDQNTSRIFDTMMQSSEGAEEFIRKSAGDPQYRNSYYYHYFNIRPVSAGV